MTGLGPAPPFTLGAALLLWGWQTGLLLYSLPMIVILELSHWVSWRWPITNKEFNILSDLSGVGFFIVVVYIFSTEGTRGIFVILSVMPLVLYLLLVIQRYSERGKIAASALFVSLRRMDPRTSPEAAAELDLTMPYVLLCIVSASSGNQRTIWFFVLTFALIGVLLWSFRPKRFSLAVWAVMLSLAFATGYATQEGIRELQQEIEASILGLFDQFMWRYRDPERASTAIGSIGRLKLSDRIVLRASLDDDLDRPLLLKEASYQKYSYGVWSNTDSTYTPIDPELNGNSWTLAEQDHDNTVNISVYMSREIGVIPLPHGATGIHDVAAIEVNQSQYGTIKMEIREGWIDYAADYLDDRLVADGPAGIGDLEVPENYREDFDRLARELDLYNKTDAEKLITIEKFYAENFQYSLDQTTRYPRGRYLSNFLFNTRAGHCEYFATTTVLLLRTAGIPARYVAGYVIDEYSGIEGLYVARSRDAHSWAIAYTGGAWRAIDTTPAVWAPVEDENASIMQPLMDIYAWISYRVSRFQTRDELEQEESNNYLLYLLVPLVLLLAWRLYFKERIARGKTLPVKTRQRTWLGMDSRLYELIRLLNQAGYVRRNGETLANWLKRVNETAGITGLEQALKLHYQYRFDPQAAVRSINNELSTIVDSILKSGLLPKTAARR